MTAQQVATLEKANGPSGVTLYDYGDDAGVGFEGTTSADYKPSFIRVLQGLSPQIETVPGAKPGLLIDTVTNELFERADFVSCYREHVMVAWKPRGDQGGGTDSFGGVYQLSDPMVKKAVEATPAFTRDESSGKIILPVTPDGEYNLVETIYFHGLQVLAGGGGFPSSIPFSSTALTVGSAWFTLARKQLIPNTTVARPLFGIVYSIGSMKREKSGNRWYVPTVQFRGNSVADAVLDPTSELYKAGREVAKQFKEGKAKVDYSKSGGETPAADGGVKEADIPF